MAAQKGDQKNLLSRIEGNPSVWEALLDGTPVGILVVDEAYRVQFVNGTMCEWLGVPSATAVGTKCHQLVYGREIPCGSEGGECPVHDVFRTGRAGGPDRFRRQPAGEREQHLQVMAYPVLDDAGKPAFAMEFLTDVTADVLLETYREEANLRDFLTGLYNRQAFNRYIVRELRRTVRQGHPFSLCLVDLDSFKDYNEKEGEQAGDALLARFGALLTRHTREAVDRVCRLEADTFAILLPEVSSDHARRVAERVFLTAEEARIPLSFSMAICEAEQEEDADALYHRATESLFEAKKGGGNRIL